MVTRANRKATSKVGRGASSGAATVLFTERNTTNAAKAAAKRRSLRELLSSPRKRGYTGWPVPAGEDRGSGAGQR